MVLRGDAVLVDEAAEAVISMDRCSRRRAVPGASRLPDIERNVLHHFAERDGLAVKQRLRPAWADEDHHLTVPRATGHPPTEGDTILRGIGYKGYRGCGTTRQGT
jgi:hypothetical protein